MRIQDLDQITNETIDLSQHLAIDDPSQSFKMTLLQLRDFFVGQLYPVGSTLFRLDNRTPNECGFPGTWTKAVPDVSIHTAATDGSNVGTNTGTNAPAVPVTQHTHTATQAEHGHAATQAAHTHAATQASHTHTGSTASAGDHSHTAAVHDGGSTDITYCMGVSDGADESMKSGYIGSAGEHTHGVTINGATPAITVPSVTPVITVPTATPVITVNNAGTAGATLDVRGARIHVHMWHRTA